MIKITEAADLFESHIYERGEAISCSDLIKITHKSADLITAIVEGTEYYDVRIMMGNGYITDMSCTCPYADTGENCKHMAAVLINCFKDTSDAGEADDSERISVKNMVSDFESICHFYLERERFINYSRASRFFNEMDRFLDRVKSLIENGSHMQAAQVIAGITKGFDDLPLDDSDGGTTDFYMRIVELLNTILSHKDEKTKDFVFSWISQDIADERNWYLSEMLQPVWESQFNESELIDKKIKQMTDRLRLPISTLEEKAEDHSFISNLIVLAELMLERGDDTETVESLLVPFMCSYRVLAWLADLARSNGHQEKEYELLKKGYELAHKKNYPGIINEFGLKLCRFYQRTGQTEEYRTALRGLVMSDLHHLEYYHEYKALFNLDEWDIERDIIIGEFKKQTFRSKRLLEIYKEEEMYDKLLKLIESRGGLGDLREYQEVLEGQYRNEVIRLYLANLDILASRQGSKKNYEDIVFWMKHIRKMSGCREIIKEKAKEYAVLYKLRSSFIRELSRVNW